MIKIQNKILCGDLAVCLYVIFGALMKLWQHEDTGNITMNEMQPSHRYFEIPMMFEDELPDDITKELYSWWFDNSFVDGVRIGPKI